uniref:Uncharacterized protein n=1 Tax=Anopheles farauti TaxID=69004 RepID=A0A182Q8P9_9DIPT
MSSGGSDVILAPNQAAPHPFYSAAFRTQPLLILAALQQYTSTDQQQQQQQQQQRVPPAQDTATVCNGGTGNGALHTEQQHSTPGKAPNTLLLHCCCVIVQITPVAPGRSHVTTTASAKKSAIGDDGGGGGGGGGGGAAGSGAAGSSSGRTPVCRCNAQYKLQDLKALKKQSLAASNVQSSSTSALNAIGQAQQPLQGILTKSSTGTGHRQHQPLQQQHSSQSLAYSTTGGTQPQPPPPRQSQELSNEELIKFLQQINADIKWIEQLQQYKYEIEKSTSTDKTNARNMNKPSVGVAPVPLANGHLGKPKSEPMLPSVAATATGSGAISKTEFFDRNLKQRHSSRSVDASTARRDEDEYGKDGGGGGHQRHSSGPSDLQLLKSDISEWLLNLPLKKSVEILQKAKSAQLKYEKEQEQLQLQLQQLAGKKPLQRQASGGGVVVAAAQHPPQPAEIALTRDDILEWLKKQQIFSKVNEETSATKKCKDKEELTLHQYDPAACPSRSGTSAATGKLLKRHSLGPNEEFFHQQHQQQPTTDWIQYPLRQLKKHTFDPTQSSCTDVRRTKEHGHRERRLRHSASEVVTSSQSDLPVQSRIAPQKPERTFRYHSRDRDARVATSGAVGGVPTARQHSLPQIPIHHHPLPQPQPQPLHYFQYPPPQPQPSTSTFVPQAPPVKSAKKERSRRHRTQRSATVGDINQFNKSGGALAAGGYRHGGRLHSGAHSRSAERSASLTRCADPSCSVMSLCDDPNCYLFGGDGGPFPSSGVPNTNAVTAAATTTTTSYYDTPRCASLPRVLPKGGPKCGPLCYECNNKCNSLPRCTDARCQVGAPPPFGSMPATSAKPKSNSLPRNAENYTYQQHQQPPQPPQPPQPALRGAGRLSREESRCSLPRSSFKSAKKRSASASGSGSNGSKLTKSLSAASLNSRRRRHKTVHFGENLLREVCQNRKLIQPLQETPSGSAPLQPNIQMLYNFVEGVLSAWVDDEDDPNKSGPESEPERGAILKPMHRCNRARFQTIRRVVNEAAELKGSSKLGNSRYRHRHWRGTAKDCNERFLRKQQQQQLRHTLWLCTVRRMHTASVGRR